MVKRTDSLLLKPGTSSIVASNPSPKGVVDFSKIKDQYPSKRGMEIAAAGFHNILIIGPKSSGKSMLLEALPSILPGNIPVRFLYLDSRRNLKTIIPHYGVLIIDDMSLFDSTLINELKPWLDREPFMLAASFEKVASPAEIASGNKIPGHKVKKIASILDRFELKIMINPIQMEAVFSQIKEESSCVIKKRISRTWEVQDLRYKKFHGEIEKMFNGKMDNSMTLKFCKIDEDGEKILEAAEKKFNLTPRDYFNILKVARTIADLAGWKRIRVNHLHEAMQYIELAAGRQCDTK